ncbi:hypothetical protein E4T52_11746 [Aureobasidium sp. EXF-3400]|nr:hypothetical protein E4T51_05120 [Aureobasidium sp. EXF-12344]KAI4773256.1 hypothetical protein E4T52_11746 [Aureobasidium sp. EXF-3400]
MADLNTATKKTASPTSPKKNSWLSKLRHPSRSQEGTVLHAVPHQKAARPMSALDIAIHWKKKSIQHESFCLSAQQLPHRVRGVSDNRIGVWRDGVAFWDIETNPKTRSGATLQSSKTTPPMSKADRSSRPRLSVQIPSSKLRQILGEEAPIPPQPLKPICTILTTTNTRRSLPSQATNLDQSSVHPAFRTTGPSVESSGSEVTSLSSRENSRSSVSSNTISQDDMFDIGSCYSRHSSMTSLETESPSAAVQNSHWNYLDVPKRSASAAFSITDPVKAGIFDEVAEDKTIPLAVSGAQYLKVASHPNHRAPSPTLSEAVFDLQQQLSTIAEGPSATSPHDVTASKTPNFFRHTIDNVSRAPTLPKKSRKRQWIQPALAQSVPVSTTIPVRQQSVPHRKQKEMKHHAGDVRRVSSARCSLSADLGSMWLSWNASSAKKVPALAFEQEAVCSRIMAFSTSFEDLKTLSMVNKTAREYFEANKLQLLKSVLFNVSAPAWELRELSPFPFGNFMPTDFLEDTEISPSAYVSCVKHDRAVVKELKTIIATKCQWSARPETIASLMTDNCTRFEDVIYRIWSFCKMFGCDRGRENDLKGQIDWLKGGILAHQKGCAATMSFSPEFEIDGILLNAPEHFAAGNGSGLSAEQLYDMLEIWSCLYTLMQPYEGETEKAHSCGLFRPVDEHVGHPEVQSRVIEEWISYILSLGPSVVLELARFDDASAGFDFAHLNDWTDWTPPLSGMTRGIFFRDPVTQVYEERLLASTAGTQAQDVTLLRKCQTEEMNIAHRQMSQRNRKSDNPACALSRHDSALAPEVHKRPNARRLSTPTPTSPRSPSQNMSWSPRKVSPIIEDRVDTFNRLSMLSFEGMAEDTSGLAIGKIMDIGFSNAQAKEALRITDMGSGLRVDRAVDWLLRQNRF